MSDQASITYENQAQIRVAADTRLLEKRVTLTAGGDGTVALPADVITILSVTSGGDTQLRPTNLDYLLSELSLAPAAPALTDLYVLLGRTLYASAGAVLDVVYSARPLTWTSDADLEVTGEYEDLTDRLLAATLQLDQGDAGVASAAMADYEADAAALNALARRRHEPVRLLNAGLGDIV